jgi:hypothetical protein
MVLRGSTLLIEILNVQSLVKKKKKKEQKRGQKNNIRSM